MNIDVLIEKGKTLAKEKEVQEMQERTLEENIRYLANKLKEYERERKIINELKEKKDKLIVEYIESVKQPDLLNLELINYKALYFFFKKNFIENKKILYFNEYSNNLDKLQKNKKSVFHNAFDQDGRIYLDIKETNFPHLIGYKTSSRDNNGTYDNSKNSKFLNSIYYETSLIEDYEDHDCKIDKIQRISWIWRTLREPLFVFDQDGIRNGDLKTDLLFIKRLGGKYHYVSLIKLPKSSKNKYVINSHHSITHDSFKRKYNQNKAIYIFQRK
jgi:hypothetical protein